MSADNTQKIKDALAKLDVKNDSQWTEEGQPRIEAMRMLSGVFNLTREEVTATDPNFSRTNTASAAAAPASTPADLVGADQAAAAATATTPVETPPVITEVAVDAASETDPLARIDWLRNYKAGLEEDRDEIANALHATEQELMALEATLNIEDPLSSKKSQEAIAGYLEQQKENLKLRARRIEQFAGLDMSQFPRRAPIDEARARSRMPKR